MVLNSQEQVRFETLVLPHLDVAFNLARWLLRSGVDAEDASQEAMLRGYRFFNGFHGGDVRAWLLQIVRSICFTWLDKKRLVKDMTEFDEELHGPLGPHPESLAVAADSHERLTQALEPTPQGVRVDQRRRSLCTNILAGARNWAITIENTEERPQTIILSTIAKRARRLFEQRGHKDAFEPMTGWQPTRSSGAVNLMATRPTVLGIQR
jgi:RNA polymerase sigma-70 factor, ECF subfamily